MTGQLTVVSLYLHLGEYFNLYTCISHNVYIYFIYIFGVKRTFL
jgi:hypothetical protein